MRTTRPDTAGASAFHTTSRELDTPRPQRLSAFALPMSGLLLAVLLLAIGPAVAGFGAAVLAAGIWCWWLEQYPES